MKLPSFATCTTVIWQLVLLLHSASAAPYNAATEISQGLKKTVDIGRQVADFTPSLDDIAAAGKDLVLGAPFQVLLEGLNQVCSLALATQGDLERAPEIIPEMTEVRLKFLDNKHNRSFDVHSVADLVQMETFDKHSPTVVVTTGWLSMRGNKTSRSAEKLLRAYQCRGKHNFLLFDSAEYIATIYTWSARNTEILGQFLGNFLVALSQHVDMQTVHLIGHSLGAQISGEAGRRYQEVTGKLLPRITALDPARPCFNEGEVLNGVGRGDAEFVDVIHTNNGALGQRHPLGDADFYPNGVTVLQPGSLHIGSSHKRALELFAESVLPGNEAAFMATKCNSLFSLGAGLCTKTARVPMGYAATAAGKGNFFLRTNSKAPFGTTGRNSCRGEQNDADEDYEDSLPAGVAGEGASGSREGVGDEGDGQTKAIIEETTTKKSFLSIFG